MTIPYNIDIHFDDFCKDCKICEIDIKGTEHIGVTPYFGNLHIYHIGCRNQEVCRMWRDKMRGDVNE